MHSIHGNPPLKENKYFNNKSDKYKDISYQIQIQKKSFDREFYIGNCEVKGQ